MDLRAVIFVPALVGSVIAGFVFLLFAAHYYLTVLEGTGAGAKEVTWISEPDSGIRRNRLRTRAMTISSTPTTQ